jgi:Domain of unknown function (DUF3303)
MIFITTYTLKPYMSPEEGKEMMARFAEVGPGPGTTAHYVAADGSGGLVISDNDDLGATYRNVLEYGEWLSFDSTAVLTVDEAVPHIMDSLT